MKSFFLNINIFDGNPFIKQKFQTTSKDQRDKTKKILIKNNIL